jgi:HPt (histidine-containing phosphotransfer) domain-containing protein
MNRSAVIDWEYLESLRELQPLDEPDVVQELVSMFSADSQLRQTLLHDAVRRHSSEEIRQVAHSLRGSAGQVGAIEVARLSGLLEAAAATFDWDADTLVRQVDVALREALSALDEGGLDAAAAE